MYINDLGGVFLVVIEINKRTGAIVEGERITLQQEVWNGSELKNILLKKEEIITLADKLKSMD